jgi:peptidoglycan/xylan/chitin deacetylase (PgdA/CDA1 family)
MTDRDLFTAREEYAPTLTDGLGRSPHYASANRRVSEAVISRKLHAEGFRPHYPHGHTFAACLSHDLDLMLIGLREKVGSMRAGQLPVDARTLKDLFRQRTDPRYSVENIIRMEDTFDASSSFYFMALAEGDKDHNYDLSRMGDQIAMLREADRDIGLHGGHTAYRDASALKREKERLEKALGRSITGYRNHFLRFTTPHTWRLLEGEGFVYDTTFGYSDRAGFRNGMAYPFRPYDLERGGTIDIVEVPLVLMDAALLFNMKLSIDQARTFCFALIAEARAVNGVITLLWHNNYMQGSMGELYRELLEHLHDQGAWLTDTERLVRHWKSSGLQEAMEEVLHAVIGPPASMGEASVPRQSAM